MFGKRVVVLYIYGCYMKKRGKLLTNTVVTTVMSNFGLYKAFDEQGIGYVKTELAHKLPHEEFIEYLKDNGIYIVNEGGVELG